jgi:regulatory protein
MAAKSKKSPWDRALKYLTIRPRSEKEIRDYLGEECTEEIITKLKDYKFLDDEEFSKWYVEQRARFRPRGQKLLNFELKRKGIAPVEVDDRQLAGAALAKKMRLWGSLDYPEFRIKATRFLASRGFGWGTIEETVKKTYNDSHVN